MSHSKKVANGDIWFYTERDWNQECCHGNNIAGVILFLLRCTVLVPSLKITAAIFVEIFLIQYFIVLVERSMTSSLSMVFTGQEIHNYNTRNSNFFRVPSCRTNVRKFSPRFQGPKIFNSINDEIKNSLSLREFTSKLKSTFLV